MIVPGWLVAAATFPGIIVHEAAHMMFCRLRGVAVFDACFLRVGNPMGYVVHERVDNFTTNFLISVGPFIGNSLLCMVLCFPAFLRVRAFALADPISYVLLWLGVSVGMHAFPSNGDAANLWRCAVASAKRFNPLAILSLPLVGLIYLANLGSFFWLDYLYGVGIGLGLPELLLQKLV
jgi:hypothetical protein